MWFCGKIDALNDKKEVVSEIQLLFCIKKAPDDKFSFVILYKN